MRACPRAPGGGLPGEPMAGAGTLDGRYHLILPVGEHGATAADGRVVSVAFPPGAVCRGSTLIVRDLRQGGAKLLELSRPDAVGYAVLRGDTLYFAGSCGTDGIPGVYAASLVDGSVRTLIAPYASQVGAGDHGSCWYRDSRFCCLHSGSASAACLIRQLRRASDPASRQVGGSNWVRGRSPSAFVRPSRVGGRAWTTLVF
jgi:hypothetical protein